MESEPDPNYKVECFKQNQTYEQHSPKGTTVYQNQLKFMPNFKVQWLLKCRYPFKDLSYLPGNPMNENQPVYKSFNS